MYTEKIFKQIKTAMSKEVRNLSLEDIKSHLEWANAHYEILEKLVEIEEMNKSREIHTVKKKIVEEVDTEINTESPQAAPSAEPVSEESTVEIEDETAIDLPKTIANRDIYPIGYRFTYTQKASGGVIEALNYPFAEEYARANNLENGNIVKITGVKGQFHDRRPQYAFEIVDDRVVNNPSLGFISHGIVEETAGRLVVMKTANGRVQIDENNVVLYIQDKDINKIGIKEGDIVDGRFYNNSPEKTFRVSFVHETEAYGEDLSVEQRRLSYRQNNPVESEPGESMISRMDLEPLKNKRLLLIGLSSRAHHFKLALSGEEAKDLDFVHLTGDETKDKIRSEIAHADIVLLATQMNSHDASKYSAAVCKQFGVPVTDTHADGLTGVFNDAKDLLEAIPA